MLRIRLLGRFEAICDGEPLPGLGPQLRRLLARLVLDAGSPLELRRLATDLWPQSDTLDVVQKSLQRLQNALGEEKWRLKNERGAVIFTARDVDVDLVQFDQCIERGNLKALAEAVTLYRGPLLEDWDGDWLTERREDYKTSYLDAIKLLASEAMKRKDWLLAAHYLRRFVNGCPEMEWGWECLIDSYLQGTNRLQALETYQIYLNGLRISGQALAPSPRIEARIATLNLQEVQQSIAQVRALPHPALKESTPFRPPWEPVGGGAVPLDSPYYIERAEDAILHEALQRQSATLLLKGPRQIGKSSLLARIMHRARQNGACVLLTDWQNMAHAELATAEAFFLTLAERIVDQLDLECDPRETFQAGRPAASSFERFLRRQVFPTTDQPVVWAIDEADRIFSYDYSDDVFSKLRAWHNERALAPNGPWQRFSMVIAYSTEANLFIRNVHQSPFNVGIKVVLPDFTLAQVGELNRRYDGPLKTQNELEQLYRLVGGNPWLVRCSLDAMCRSNLTVADIESEADRNGGIFADHLERMLFVLQRDESLTESVRSWLKGEPIADARDFVRLSAAGVMSGEAPNAMRPRCQLYDRYLRKHLASS